MLKIICQTQQDNKCTKTSFDNFLESEFMQIYGSRCNDKGLDMFLYTLAFKWYA